MPTATTTRSSKQSSTTNGRRRSKGFEVIAWIEAHCRYTNGEWIGRPFRLLAWQKRVLLELFEIDPETALRRFRWALIGVPKKNGKTELAAAIALYLLIGDGERAPLVICAAASDDQADLVYEAARKMCELSPTLSQITERYEREILVPSLPGARLRRVAAVAGTNDGQNIHAVICDELHEWSGPKGRNVWTVLTNGTGSRRQPMVVQITTAGYDLDDTICGEQYRYGRMVEAGEIEDRRFYFHWIEAPTGSDHRDPAVWQACNPSWGVTLPNPEAFFADQLTKKRESEFRRYFLNQWTASREAWLPAGAWSSCASPTGEIDNGAEVVLGFDGSFNNDSTALVAVRCADPFVDVVAAWERPITARDDWQVPIVDVEAAIREACTRWQVREIACDPYRWARTIQALESEGLPIVEFPQNPSRMTPATQRFYEAVVNGTISHSGDPRLARHIDNCVLRTDARGTRLSKESRNSSRKIDLAVAAVMAYDRACQTIEPPPEVRVVDLAALLSERED